MLQTPTAFEGSLADLYRDQLQHILPHADEVAQIHEWMELYCCEEGPVFPVRRVTSTERRKTYSTRDGTKIVAADNSPAWVLHGLIMENRLCSYPSFRDLMRTIPTHMFDIAKSRVKTANSFKWYVAHIFPAKNRDTQFQQWDREEVERRFYLTLHPCNLFFVPGVRNRALGENTNVIRFIANQYVDGTQQRGLGFYREFKYLLRLALMTHATPWSFDWTPASLIPSSRALKTPMSGGFNAGPIKSSYESNRLTFKRDYIEPLALDDLFEVITPMGTYRFTKADFYSEFPSIPCGNSYRDGGAYHGRNLHLKARRFRITTDEQKASDTDVTTAILRPRVTPHEDYRTEATP